MNFPSVGSLFSVQDDQRGKWRWMEVLQESGTTVCENSSMWLRACCSPECRFADSPGTFLFYSQINSFLRLIRTWGTTCHFFTRSRQLGLGESDGVSALFHLYDFIRFFSPIISLTLLALKCSVLKQGGKEDSHIDTMS